MKIYNKSNFFLGLFLSVLGLALFFVSIWKGFDLKGSVLMVLCLFFGIGVMIRSFSAEMSREDKISERDERNILIQMKSRGMALRLSEGVCFVCLIVCMLGHSVIGEVLAVPMTLAFGIMLAVMMLLELILAIYYDRKI